MCIADTELIAIRLIPHEQQNTGRRVACGNRLPIASNQPGGTPERRQIGVDPAPRLIYTPMQTPPVGIGGSSMKV
ncbi:hypothetical protein HLH26_03785 [Gluconacetobacter sp. 1b LMG 1731]|uniref:Uncharacterized protein n=1 Tax=Gluconacetobacter dulcium TaxID=2729096 RepID=A0A7W4IIU7_9PROT|nr:hypothetical protein [Gluconacetobacter dulcium]MBB2192915.1 hypothetical protein [Gluconacetobacter dulcium]